MIPLTAANLTSFVSPGRAYTPPLSAKQESNLKLVSTWKQGLATVSASRNFSAIGAQNLNCGTGYLNPYFREHFVGISSALYAQGQYCGLCMNVTCVDTVCPRAMLDFAIFTIVDSCEQCGDSDFTISAPGEGNLTGVDYNLNPTLRFAWTPVTCDSQVSGGIRLWPSNQNNAFFVGINLSNVMGHVASVTLSGVSMTYQSYGYWTINSPSKALELPTPLTLTMTSSSGQSLSVVLPGLVALDLGVNFKTTSA